MLLFEEVDKFFKEKYLSFEEYLNLGIKLREEGFPDKALKIHKSLFATPKLKKEDERKLKMEIGFDYFEMKDYKNALKYLVEANKLYKGKEKILKEKLLYTLEKNNLWEEAADLKKTILIEEKKFTEKEFSFYLSKAGENLYLEGNHKEAREFFIKSIKTYDKNPIAHFYLAEMEENKDKKIDYYKKALQIDQNIKKIVYEKVENFLFEQGDYESFERFLEERNDELARCFLAEYLFKEGKESEVKRILEEIESDDEEVNKKGLEIAVLIKDIKLIEKFDRKLNTIYIKKGYECRFCNYKSKDYRFFCPECGGEFSFIKI
uniref:Tetratricopeptide repeat protein n=1 Tax=candidate division WOR-3 bacterium TaxID=2052148 RepID=A0A7V4E2G4_UNCW3